MPPAIAWTPTRAAPAAPPPPPEPGFFEGGWDAFRGQRNVQIDDIPGRENLRRNSAYMAAIEALGEVNGEGMAGYLRGGWNMGSTGVDEDKFWRDLAAARARNPAALKGWFADRGAFDKTYAGAVAQGRAADEAAAATGGLGVRLAGGATGAMADPVNILTAPMGGAAKTILGAALKNAGVNLGIEAFETPLIAAERERMGRELTPGEAVTNIALAGVGGAVLGGGFKAAGKAVELAVPAGRRVANAFKAAVPAESRTADEAAAVHVLERDADIEEANPFRPDGAGTKAHGERLAAAGAKLVNPGEARLAKPRPRPAGAVRAREPAPSTGSGRAGTLDTAIVAGLRARGFPDHVVRGVAAGIHAESRSNPNVRGGYKGRALGIGQWLGDRRAEIIRRYGETPTLDQQLDFIAHELRGGDFGGKKVLAQGDEAAVLNSYIRDFMRPAKGRETSGDLERGMAALGRRGERAPEGAADEAAPDWRDELDARDAALAAERDALDAGQAALRRDGAEPVVREEPGAEAFDPGPPPRLREDLFPDAQSHRAAQADLDRQFFGNDQAAADLWRRSQILADVEERGQRASDLEALFGADRVAELRDTARAYRAGDIDERTALDTIGDGELDRAARFEQATGDPADREGFYRAPDGTERQLAEVIAELDQGNLPLRGEAGRVASAETAAPGKVLQVIETDTGRVVETFRAGVRRADADDFAKRASQWTGPVGKAKTRYHVTEADAASPATIERQQATAREALAEWDDPAGPAALAQTGSVLHDLKAETNDLTQGVQLEAEGGAVSIEAMLDDIAEDFAIVAAIKGCL